MKEMLCGKYKRILKLRLQYMPYVLFKTELMRLDLTLFSSSGMERIVQKCVSEEINPRNGKNCTKMCE